MTTFSNVTAWQDFKKEQKFWTEIQKSKIKLWNLVSSKSLNPILEHMGPAFSGTKLQVRKWVYNS